MWLLERARDTLGLDKGVEVTLRQYVCKGCGARDQTAEVSLRSTATDLAKARRSVIAFARKAEAAAEAAREALRALDDDATTPRQPR